MKKTSQSSPRYDHDKEYDVLVEPLVGHDAAEITDALNGLGASKVRVLAAGFISARASGAALQNLEGIGEVHLKAKSRLHERP